MYRGGKTVAEISFKNVVKIFENKAVGLNHINLEIEKGEFVFLVGKSGVGKSTSLRLLTKEIEPTKGKIYVRERDLAEITRKELPYFRRSMGIVWQQTQLLPKKTVYENVAFALEVLETDKKKIAEDVPAALGLVNMNKKADRYPKELSGGECLRVALARAMVNNPSILIADEPTGNLDQDTAWDIMCLLDEANRCGITVVVATHALELARLMKKRIIVMRAGYVARDIPQGGVKAFHLVD